METEGVVPPEEQTESERAGKEKVNAATEKEENIFIPKENT